MGLLALTLALSPIDGALAADGPDVAACQAKQGQEYGQCVAQLALAARDSDSQAGIERAPAADASARAVVEACQDQAERGEGIGDCVSDAVQTLHDTGDTPAKDVAADAKELVDSCQGKVGQAFGECVSAQAQALGASPGGPAAAPASSTATARDDTPGAPEPRGAGGRSGDQSGRVDH